jgi:hypothetical protein
MLAPIRGSQIDVDKIILSAGFWVTLALFVALGYAFSAECPGSVNCSDEHAALSSPASQYQDRSFENDARASDSRSKCKRGDAMFPQVANWQRGGSMYAPGLSITVTGHHATLCPGPVEIPQTLVQ